MAREICGVCGRVEDVEMSHPKWRKQRRMYCCTRKSQWSIVSRLLLESSG